ncbi:putative integral membrane protein [marine actinobacterium PHSC20C1]|nr:putative integral membrane protein [marine actinobacterium PHSC20C1]
MSLDLRLSIPVAFAWLVAVLLIGAPQWSTASAVALWFLAGLVAAVALAAGSRSGILASVALACALAALCSTSVALQEGTRKPDTLTALAARHAQVQVVATTTSTERLGDDYFHARVSSVSFDGESVQLDSPALVFRETGGFSTNADGDEPAILPSDTGWGIGVEFVVTGSLTVTEPGDGRALLVFASDEAQWRANPGWWIDWANQLRYIFAEAARALPGGGGELMAGLAIGDTSAVTDDLDAAMKTSSLSHLTAVSGANCAIVVGLIMLLGARMGVHRVVRIVLAVMVLLAFVIVVTPDPSVLRAALMATFVLFALGSGRPIRGMAVLSIAAISLLVFDPWLSRNFAFALSVFATAGLLLFAEPLSKFLSQWMPRGLSLVIAVPLAAQLACQPLLLLLQPSLPTYGVVANVLAAPAAPVATVVGLAACVVLPVVPALGTLLIWIAWLPSAWVAAVAMFFAGLPGARIPWLEGWIGVAALCVITALLLMSLMMRHPWRRRAAVALVVITTLAGAVVVGSHVSAALSWPRDWQYAQCDVGQGDAVVVRSLDRVALVDTGAAPPLLTECLDRLGIDRIDLLVLTHFDHDHVGGAEAVVGRADTVLVGPVGSEQDARLLEQFSATGAQVIPARTGDQGELGELRWTVAWPAERLSGIDPGNDASVIIEFVPRPDCSEKCLSSVFLGDLGQSAQSRLVAEGGLSPVDVVKVSHHGSGDQFPQLYVELQATVGLVGVGAANGYGHPTPDALQMLDDAGTLVVRSDTSGLVLVSPGSGSGMLRMWSERRGGIQG